MFDWLKEVAASAFDNLKQKRKSPLYGAFAFSWVAHNWQPLLILFFSKKNINSRIADLIPFKSSYDQFLGPLWWSVVLIFLVPIIHAIYSFFDSWVGSLHDSTSVKREILNLRKRRELIELQQAVDASAERAAAEEKTKIAEEAKKAARHREQERLAISNIDKIGQLEDEIKRLEKMERMTSESLATLDQKYNMEGRRWSRFDSESKAAMIALQEAKEMADKGEHPGMKIQEAKTHLSSAMNGPVMG